jgi:hypothetical protein
MAVSWLARHARFMRWRERWTVRKKVVCPGCGDVMAEVVHRWWPPVFTVRAPAGYEIMPQRSGAVERELDAGRLTGVGDEGALRKMLLYYHADLIYTLTCPRGHVTVRAEPQVVRAVRRAGALGPS